MLDGGKEKSKDEESSTHSRNVSGRHMHSRVELSTHSECVAQERTKRDRESPSPHHRHGDVQKA